MPGSRMKVKKQKLPPPKSVSISITGKCNLKCNYCFYANEMAGLKDLPTETWLKFFAELGKIGIMDASLTGDFNRANPEDCFKNFLQETGASYGLRT
jgi:MoaA/NifB/PqqE/SkfB family radical SAM enzyme